MCKLTLCRFLCALQLVTGTSVRYQNPVVYFDGPAPPPGTLSPGMEAWLLFYGTGVAVYLRLAIGVEMDTKQPTSEYWEVLVRNIIMLYKVIYSNESKDASSPNEDIAARQRVSVLWPGMYFWVRLVFTGKDCEFYLDGKHLGSHKGYVDNTKAHLIALRKNEAENNCRLMEMHFTCPAGAILNFFPIGKYDFLSSPPATSFSSGGNVRVTGEYELTDSSGKNIWFFLGDNKDDPQPWHIPVNRGETATLQYTFAVQGGRLILLQQDRWQQFFTVKEGWKTFYLSVVRNFRVHKLEVSTGANIWKPT